MHEAFKINKRLLPLKLTIFFYSGSMYSILPYLTIHMKDIGINDVDVALIYTILPFTVFLALPFVGFLADKLGNFTRVLLVNVVGCAIFHTLLLAVPHTPLANTPPPATARLDGGNLTLSWGQCAGSQDFNSSCPDMFPEEHLPNLMNLNLLNCSLTCSLSNHTQILTKAPVEQHICSLLADTNCKANLVRKLVRISDILPLKMEKSPVDIGVDTGSQGGTCGQVKGSLGIKPDPCIMSNLPINHIQVELPQDCSLQCQAETNIIGSCLSPATSQRLLNNSLYFLFRSLATICLASCYILLDAQTIQMTIVEENNGNSGAYGRQIMYNALAQAIVSPLIGLIMDKLTELTGYTNYLAPFLISDLLLLITLVCILLINMDLGLPKGSDVSWKEDMKAILSNWSVVMFLLSMFVCGSMYGFVETFLFIYLKEDLNAPIFLLGLTITTGALISCPFLYIADYLVDKAGKVNVIVWALLMYGVRYVGYSYITCAWFAFPFEALEIFTLYILRVAAANYIKVYAPPGTLATLTGISKGAHFGFGKGLGALLGGVLKGFVGSTALAFRIFGVASFGFGALYGIYHFCYGRHEEARNLNKINKVHPEKNKNGDEKVNNGGLKDNSNNGNDIKLNKM